MHVTKKWQKIADVYKFFARDYQADFSDSAAEAMFDFESNGIGLVAKDNGYAIGKHLMDIQLAMWMEDLYVNKFMLTKYELITDPTLKDIRWFLEDVFGPVNDSETNFTAGTFMNNAICVGYLRESL